MKGQEKLIWCSDIPPMLPTECGVDQLPVYRPDIVYFSEIKNDTLYAFADGYHYEMYIFNHPQRAELESLKRGDGIKLNWNE